MAVNIDYEALATELVPLFDEFSLSFWSFGVCAILSLIISLCLLIFVCYIIARFCVWLEAKIISFIATVREVRQLRKEVDHLKTTQAPAAPAADQKEAE